MGSDRGSMMSGYGSTGFSVLAKMDERSARPAKGSVANIAGKKQATSAKASGDKVSIMLL